MKEIEILYLSSFPYCLNARKAVAELCEENPAYASLKLIWIEESEQPEIAESRDYYSVPSVFFEGRKLYEAHFTHSYGVIKEKLRKAFDEVLSA